MKKFVLFLLVLGSSQLMAQNTANLVIFSDQGEQFFAYINSVQQNEAPSSNVKITDFPAEFARVRIEFQDESLGSIDRNIMLQFGYELTARITQNRKGVYVLRPFGDPVAIQQAPVYDEQPVIIYHSEPLEESVDVSPPAPSNDAREVNGQETIETTIHTTDTRVPGNGASIGINVDGLGINMNVDVREPGTVGTGSTTMTTTTTTTTNTTTTGTPQPTEKERQPRPERPSRPERPEPVEEIVMEPLVPGYNGPVGCSHYLMSDQQFEAAKKSISTKSFEDDKMTLARQISNNQCLTTEQVIGIMNIFTFEASKIDWAKTAYAKTYDIGNYWMLNDHFTFSSSIDDLNKFIESQR